MVIGAVAWSLLVPAAAAQENPNIGRRVSLVVGPLFVSQRDEKASPVRYGGAAPFLEVGYTTRTNRRKLDVRVGGAYGVMRSALTGSDDLPRQQTGRGWLDVEYSRSVVPAPSRTRWFVGGLVSTHATVIVHFYDAASANKEVYALFSTTLGPVISVERARSERTLSARLSVPIVALIARPYDVFVPLYGHPRPSGTHLDSRVVTIGTLQAGDFSAAYTATHRSGANLVLGYHLVVERYRDDEPFRFASQALSLTLALRLGGG